MAEVDFSKEIRAFERQLPELQNKLGGRWVVFLDGSLKGRFQSFGDAVDFASVSFPERDYLIRDIEAQKTELPFLLVVA